MTKTSESSDGIMVLAIDPGTTESGVCLTEFTVGQKPFIHAVGKMANDDVFSLLEACLHDYQKLHLVIERVASYGMPVGAEVFETCEWIGRFVQAAYDWRKHPLVVDYIYRREEKLAICRSPKANDGTIRQALVDRYAPGQKNHGKGTKKEPGFFYGFKADAWMAFAVAVTYAEKVEGGKYGWRY